LGSASKAQPFLMSTLHVHGHEWQVSWPCRFAPGTLDASQRLSGRYGENMIALAMPVIETTFFSHTDRSLVAIPTELRRLLISKLFLHKEVVKL
jgi:hypothetical protein